MRDNPSGLDEDKDGWSRIEGRVLRGEGARLGSW